MSPEIAPAEPEVVETPAREMIVSRPVDVASWSPKMVIPIEQSVAQIEQRREFMSRVLDRIDGALASIPGVSKKVLGKPGAEALLSAFGLRAELEDDGAPILDFTGQDHGGEPFFHHRQRCRIYWYPDANTRICVAQASGSCNSWESKYRYRNAQRICPECRAEAIIKGKEEYGGGWVCFKKKGGCGAKFKENETLIIDQQVGKVSNPDLADVENTVLKMAAKRALVAATIIATAFSDLVTQDLEDNAGGTGSSEEAVPPAPVLPRPNQENSGPVRFLKPVEAIEVMAAFNVLNKADSPRAWEILRSAGYAGKASGTPLKWLKEQTDVERRAIYDALMEQQEIPW